jgi:6-phosphogluconolactonase
MAGPELVVVRDAEALAVAAAARWVAACHHAVARRGRFAVALAGGTTPLPLYRRLAERGDLPWERVVVAFGDERYVPPDDAARNERAVLEALQGGLGLADDAVLGWGWGDEPDRLAEAYARRLTEVLGDPPRFDLVVLGLGADGHTASLWPGDAALDAETWTAVSRAPDGSVRLTLTPRTLERSEDVHVLVAGAEKRAALAELLAELDRPTAGTARAGPLARLAPEGALVILADEAASGPADGVTVEG